MQPQALFCREAGAGTSVVCLHSSASSSGQWRALMDRLGRRFRVIAVDLYGSGKTVAWPQDQPMHLDDEIALLRSVFQAAGDRFHLIGHSYGGAVALKAALTHQDRLISLVLYEPVLFSVLMANAPQSDAAREIVAVRDDTIRLVDEGNLNASAERFVDYWTGDGAWAAIPEPRRPAIAEAMRAVKPEWHALFHESTPLGSVRRDRCADTFSDRNRVEGLGPGGCPTINEGTATGTRTGNRGCRAHGPSYSSRADQSAHREILGGAQLAFAGDAPNSARA